MKHIVVVIVLTVEILFSATDALKCYRCNKLSHPKDCEHLVECGHNEVCYVEGNITHENSLQYTSGCLSNRTCSAILHADSGQHHILGKRDARFCQICCNKDFCNTELCDRKDTTINSGPKCMSCKSIDDPRQCLQETQCRNEETCFTVQSATAPVSKYDMGCIPTRDCNIGYAPYTQQLIGRSASDQCSQCCIGDHCNLHLCTGESVQSYGLITATRSNSTCDDLNQEMCSFMITVQGQSCSDENIAQMCKKSCNKCGSDTCRDTTDFDCAVVARHFNICADTEQAKRSCAFFCNYCNPVDGTWSIWSSWEQCVLDCNYNSGKQIRRRQCDSPAPSHGGRPCPGKDQDVRNCTIPINGGWSSWSSWGKCSSTCNNGTKTRARTCTNPSPYFGGSDCIGEEIQYSQCFITGCIVDGGWSEWSQWSLCSTTCNNGTKIRSRNCTNPSPSNGGSDCIGDAADVSTCFITGCPVDGGWTSWSNWLYYIGHWGYNNFTFTIRNRSCENPKPSYGGMKCDGPTNVIRIYGTYRDCDYYTPKISIDLNMFPTQLKLNKTAEYTIDQEDI